MTLRYLRWPVGILALLALIALLTPGAFAWQEEPPALDWPRTIEVPEGRVVVYQPQIETFDSNRLTGLSAVSVTPAGKDEPIFGAIWLDAQVATDRNARTLKLLGLEVTDAKLPTATPDQLEKLKKLLVKEITAWDPVISLDRILTALDLAELGRKSSEGIGTAPPKIRVVTHPAVLVLIDGEPKMQRMEGSFLHRVVNTPAFMVLESSTEAYYLTDGETWLTAPRINGTWAEVKELPSAILRMIETHEIDAAETNAKADSSEVPEIIVATEPTELIVIDGEPSMTPIEGTGLLFVSNSQNDLFMEIETQRYFVLISGRWYASDSLGGTWSFVASGALPADFAAIPAESAKGEVLSSVAGTAQAVDAVSETYIPQTAAIDRSVTRTVKYDGDPQFEPIEGTSMAYAVNTSDSVIRVDGVYYCCHEAVWFTATDPNGPWTVCLVVPDVIYTMPPSSPVYNVRYVSVYDSTPDVVYVGYTPGYLGCYDYDGTVVYGTGYWYRPWHGARYIARPASYGYSFHYNPYTGNWGVRAGYGYYGHGAVVTGAGGFVAIGRHGGAAIGYRAGWWGAGGYRRYDDVNFNSTRHTPRGTITRDLNVNRHWDGDVDVNRNVSWEPNENLYERRDNAQRLAADRRSIARENIVGRERAQRSNNVFADGNGNVHRRSTEGWQRRESGGWSRAEPVHPMADRRARTPDRGSSAPAGRIDRRTTQRFTSSNPSRNLERHYQARQRGAQRTRSYHVSRGGHRGGGGRGGGGRR